MRLARLEREGKEYAGLQENDSIRVITEPGLNPVTVIAESGWTELANRATMEVAYEGARLLAPVPRPQKILCAGLNYRDHASEQSVEAPDHPILFAKMPSATIGPGQPIPVHRIATELDYEAELAVVIGQRIRGISEEAALDAVAGYTAVNDVTARNLQFADGQWVRAKSLDGYAPMGPVLVSPDEVADPGSLDIACVVNGEIRQESNTKNLIFEVSSLVAFCAEAMTLEPGDIICTGTPAGVGVFMKPPRFLRKGDVVTVHIEKVGQLTNPVGEARENGPSYR